MKELKLNKLFTGMSESVINSLFKMENFKKTKEGEVIYQSGDEANHLYLILRGDVKIKFPAKHYISKKFFNDFFGEKEIVDKTRRISSAVANSKCLLYFIEKEVIEKLIAKSSPISKNIDTYGEVELPEIEAASKSKIHLINSDKPISFIATTSKKEEPTEKDNLVLSNEESISDAVTQIIETENQNFDVDIDQEEIVESVEENSLNIGLDDSDEFYSDSDEKKLHDENNAQLNVPKEQVSIENVLKVLNSVHEPLTVYETIQSIIFALRDVTSSVAGEIYLIDENTGNMQKFINDDGIIKNVYKKISDGLTGTCVLQKKILNFDNPADDSRFVKDIDLPGREALKKIIYVPLIYAEEELVAVLQLAKENKKFSGSEIKLLESISGQLAVATVRSKRHEQLIENEKQKVKNDISMFLSDNLLIPVDIINRYTSLLNNEEFSQKVKDIISLLQKQANLFWDIIQTTLDYSKIEFEINMEKMSLNTYLASISEILSEYCDSRKINLFKKTGENVDVMIDPGKLFVALYQIVKNACDVSAEGSNLFVSTEKEDDFAKIIIRDEGSGITDDDKEKIFDHVYDETKRRNRLGLVITKKIIELHAAEISFSSKINEGTTITLSFPVYSEKEPMLEGSEIQIPSEETIFESIDIIVNQDKDSESSIEQQ